MTGEQGATEKEIKKHYRRMSLKLLVYPRYLSRGLADNWTLQPSRQDKALREPDERGRG
jgi:hypothetical protein